MRYAAIVLAALAGFATFTQASPVLAERASSSFSGTNNYYASVSTHAGPCFGLFYRRAPDDGYHPTVPYRYALPSNERYTLLQQMNAANMKVS